MRRRNTARPMRTKKMMINIVEVSGLAAVASTTFRSEVSSGPQWAITR
jgi:hypothetical protein